MNQGERVLREWPRVLIGIALAAVGGLLLIRPLTTLTVLVGVACAAPAAAAVTWTASLVRRGERGRALPVVIAFMGFAVSATALTWLPYVARVAHGILALVVIALAALPLWRARGSRDAVRIVAAALTLAAGCALAVLVVMWPDLALILTSALTALSTVIVGLALLISVVVRLLRRGRQARAARLRRRSSAGRVLRLIGSVAACAVAVTAVVASVGAQSATQRLDDFYAYDGEVPADPGRVLKVGDYAGEVPEGTVALRILYATTYTDGSPALGSAVIAYPDEPVEPGSRTVLAWQHGTTGIARHCAPSVLDDTLTEHAVPGLDRALANDWVVVIADYPGQGTAGRYPYLIGVGEATSSLDAVRAARTLDDAGASERVLLWGHSQGGHATLWAGQIAEEYAPELQVEAIAALSAASDPLAESKVVTSAGVIASVVTPFMLVPYADEYPDIELTSLVHPGGLAIVDALASRCSIDPIIIASALSATALSADAPLFSFDFEQGPVHDRLSENIADGIVPAPLFLGQGVDDEVIPISMQRALASSLEDAGRDVVVHEYPGRDHMGAIAADSPLVDDLYAWVDDVLTE